MDRGGKGGSRRSMLAIFCPESGVMVQMHNNSLIYGDICKWVTEEITQNKLIKYFWGKNLHWDDNKFDSIDRKAVETSMKKCQGNRGLKLPIRLN